MIIIETLSDGRTHTYSDIGMKIRQEDTGILYDDAVDQVGVHHEYAETDIPIEPIEPDSDEQM